MIRVPAGIFTMGSPESEEGHRAWERQREVTFAAISIWVNGRSPRLNSKRSLVPIRQTISGSPAPVDSVNWGQANEYCQQLTQRDRESGLLAEDWENRLPTEAEWDYACRAGSSEARHGRPHDVAWRFTAEEPLPKSIWEKWLKESYEICCGSGKRAKPV